MPDINYETDQWLSDGICDKCRRRKYCSTPCKRRKNYVQSEFLSTLTSIAVGCMVETNRQLSKRKRDK